MRDQRAYSICLYVAYKKGKFALHNGSYRTLEARRAVSISQLPSAGVELVAFDLHWILFEISGVWRLTKINHRATGLQLSTWPLARRLLAARPRII